MNYNFFHLSVLVVLSLLWGLHFSLVKLVDADHSPISILIPLLFILSIILVLIIYIRGELFKITYWKIVFFLLAGFGAYIIPLTLEFLVAPKIDAGILTLIVSTIPVFTLIVVSLFNLLKLSNRVLIGSFVGLLGISLLFFNKQDDLIYSFTIWLLLSLLIPICYAIDGVFMEKFWPKNLNSIQVGCGETVAALILVLIFNLFYQIPISSQVQWFIDPIFWILCFVTFLEITLFFYIIKRAGAIFVSFSSYLLIPAGFLWGFIIFLETFTIIKLISTLLIVFSIWLIGNRKYNIKNTPFD